MAEGPPSPTTFPHIILHNFRALTMGQRIGVLVLLAFGIAVIPVLALMGKEPDLVVLFSDLESQDAQAIVMQLDRQRIPYEMTENGGIIKVPRERVHELRLQMASQGLPEASGVGFEIFDHMGLGVTQFVQKMNYRRALQGELARTINQIAGVERVRVHLVMPERRVFSSEQQPAQAAVVLTLRRGGSLSQSQVHGIAHLVSSSVEGLDPSSVTVVDSHGQVLSHMPGQDDSQLTASQLDMQRKVEHDLEQRVQTMLDQVLGRNKSVVRVTAPLEFRQVEITEETFDPEGQVLRSENRNQEKVTEEVTLSGVPGRRSNVPGEAIPEGSGRPKEAKRKNETLHYELNRKVSKVVEPTGSIKRLSVAVLVDGTYQLVNGQDTGTDAEEPTSKYVPRTEAEMQKLVDIVKKAVGFSEERGDQIEVVNTLFESTPLQEGDEHVATMAETIISTWGWVIKPIVFLMFGALILMFVIRPMVTTLTTPPPQPIPLPHDGLPATVAEYEAEVSKSPEDHTAKQAMKLAAQNPTTAATVIRTWIKEEQNLKKAEKV